MNAVTYGGDCAPRAAVFQGVKAEKRTHLFARFMAALMESRRQQARRLIETHADLLSNDLTLQATKYNSPEPALEQSSVAAALAAREAPICCPITGHACEGDLSHLCRDYGCARKGGLSPRSDENI